MGASLPSEFDLIARYFTRAAPAGSLGVGDDCALFPVPAGMHIATSTDLLIQGRHFFPEVDPQALGHKALAVNLSDLAAMGAKPIGCVLGLALPAINEPWLAGFSQGFHDLADAHGCALLGGDTTRSPQDLAISVTVFGAVVADHALRRDAAQVGDHIWVSGSLGAADVAYRLLDKQFPIDAITLQSTRRALEWPCPRVELGQALVGVARSAIDISDGLLQDLGHILFASRVGARLRYGDMPVAPAIQHLAPDLIAQAVLGGGDVYELCFTAPAHYDEKILSIASHLGVPVTCIGEITHELGTVVLDVNGQAMSALPRGFDHFPAS